MRILLAEDDLDVQSTTVEIIKLEYDCDIVLANNGQEAMDILSKDTQFDLIISDHNMPQKTGADLYKFVRQKNIAVPFMLYSARGLHEISDFKTLMVDFPGNCFLMKPASGEEIWEMIEFALNPPPATQSAKDNEIKSHENQKFIGHPCEDYLKFNKTPCDIYLKLAENKYVKIVNKGSINNYEVIQKYQLKGVPKLFITENDFEHFKKATVAIATATLTQKEKFPLHLQVKNLSDGHRVFRQELRQLGIKPELVDLANASVKQTMNLLAKNPMLEELIGSLISSSDKLYAHSLLTAYFAYIIASQTKWSNSQTFEKLNAASFLHDCLLEDEASVELEFMTELDIEEISSDYFNHPVLTADLVGKIKSLDGDIATIILHHHEWPDGSGFPRKLSASQLSGLSAIFILAHHCSVRIIRFGATDEVRKEIIREFADRFSHASFKSACEALYSIIKP